MEYRITKNNRLSYRFFSIEDGNYRSIINVISNIKRPTWHMNYSYKVEW
jgi:hypothetical protein